MTMFDFQPDGGRGRTVDRAVRARLADSLEGVRRAVQARFPGEADGLVALAAAVRLHPVRPGVMALYTDAVPALLGGDEAVARAALRALADPSWLVPAAPRVVTLDDNVLGAGMAARYRRQIDDDPEVTLTYRAVDAAEMPRAQDAIAAARALLAAVAPALDAELAGLVHEIMLVDGRAEGGLVFHGASSFFLWGAVVLNLAEHRSRVKLVEGLVHEAGHALLHGLTAGGPMVRNDPAERYRSPLRDDARPMEGLVHAAYVLARMRLAMAAVLRSPELTPAERAEAEARRDHAGRGFADALRTIDAEAAFTETGATVFGGARRAMATRADGAPAPG